MNNYIIVTPINTISGNVYGNALKARNDYIRERAHFGPSEYNPKWDDSKYNNAVVGNKFGFVNNILDTMEIFTIIGIIPAEDRPDYWDIPDHQRRRILILSKKETEIPFSVFKQTHNKNPECKVQGTTRYRYLL